MKILNQFPPDELYKRIIEAFPEVAKEADVVFTYGNILYNPSGRAVPPYMLVHEEVHEKQQQQIGMDQWWYNYIRSSEFRLAQEVPAYQAEYKSFCRIYKDKNERDSFLRFQALMLSSPMYGNMLSMPEAMRKIRS